MLDDRKRRILQAIIDDYVSTAEPIGSRTIARKYDLGVSPATIRNEMADLELLGFLEQPHTSAGRIPSAKGYRFYVDCLLAPHSISERDLHLIKQWYEAKVRRIDELFQETAKLLSKVTNNVSLVMAPQSAPAKFKYLQFLPLDEQRVIAVVVTDKGIVENKIIDIPEGTTQDDLQQIAQQVNNRLTGLGFTEIGGDTVQDIKQDLILDSDVVEYAFTAITQALTQDKGEKVFLGGTTHLLNQPEFRDVDKIKKILTMLEEKRLLYDILHMQNQDGVVVTIGQENKYSGIQDCSVVQATYRIDGQVVGSVAILGPTRMEYGKTMAILEFMHTHLGELIKKYRIG
ncbi:MAG: heat-inducible transcriptional repressor HrcA [Sporomusaceae bacterium]|nr:heat-inducible transcriptional repressor HrcA [Sporomusaceae bacterium]